MLATVVFVKIGPNWPMSASFESLAGWFAIFFYDLSAFFIIARVRWQVIIFIFISTRLNLIFLGSKPNAKGI